MAGHELYMDKVKEKKLFNVDRLPIPWSNDRNIGEQEFAKITKIAFEIKSSATFCSLTVKFIN